MFLKILIQQRFFAVPAAGPEPAETVLRIRRRKQPLMAAFEGWARPDAPVFRR
jgi:hypothetical protein